MPGFNQPVPPERCLEALKDGIFSDESAYQGPNPNLEYARKYRWVFETLEPVGRNLLLNLRKCGRPSAEFEVIKIHHAQEVIYRPGKVTWAPISMSFYESLKDSDDPLGGNTSFNAVARSLYQWWANSMYNSNTSLHGSMQNYLKDGILKMVDGVGDPIWTYNLYNCWISKITPSDLDYETNGLTEFEITLCYDKAIEG